MRLTADLSLQLYYSPTTVLRVLTEQVKRLERQNHEIKNELDKARSASLETMLGPLRLREAVLVYCGAH